MHQMMLADAQLRTCEDIRPRSETRPGLLAGNRGNSGGFNPSEKYESQLDYSYQYIEK